LKTKPLSTKKELRSLLGKINFLRRFISNLSGKTKHFHLYFDRRKRIVLTWGKNIKKLLMQSKIMPPILLPSTRNKNMKLFISAYDSTIGSMLAQEDGNGVERAIYSTTLLHILSEFHWWLERWSANVSADIFRSTSKTHQHRTEGRYQFTGAFFATVATQPFTPNRSLTIGSQDFKIKIVLNWLIRPL